MHAQRSYTSHLSTLSDIELIDVILDCRHLPMLSVNAQDLLDTYDTIHKLCDPHTTPPSEAPNMPSRTFWQALGELAYRLQQPSNTCAPLNNAYSAKRIAVNALKNKDIEVLWACYCDVAKRPICSEVVATGSLREVTVYPRELAKRALSHNAAGMWLAHNHLSGSATPSQADIHMTEILSASLKLLDIEILDHWVVSECRVVSMRALGLFIQ